MPRFTREYDGAATIVEKFITSASDAPHGTDTSWMDNEEALRSAFNFVHHNCTPPVHNGAHLLRHVQKVTRFLPFGCRSLDDLLQGGLREGQILELYGESSSGKTQLCMLATAQTALRGEKVIYIDTSNSFSGRRIALMLGDNVSPSTAEAAFENIVVIKAYTAHDVIHHLTTIMQAEREKQRATHTLSTIHTDQQKQGDNDNTIVIDRKDTISLIVVDSIGAIISPLLGGGQHTQGHTILTALSSLLKEIAMQYNIAVLVTNHLVSSGNSSSNSSSSDTMPQQWIQDKKAALGESWQHQAHVRVQLVINNKDATTSGTTSGGSVYRTAILKKSTTQPTSGNTVPQTCTINITFRNS